MTAIANYNKFKDYTHLKADRLEYTDTHVYVFYGEKLMGIFAIDTLDDIFLVEKENGK